LSKTGICQTESSSHPPDRTNSAKRTVSLQLGHDRELTVCSRCSRPQIAAIDVGRCSRPANGAIITGLPQKMGGPLSAYSSETAMEKSAPALNFVYKQNIASAPPTGKLLTSTLAPLLLRIGYRRGRQP